MVRDNVSQMNILRTRLVYHLQGVLLQSEAHLLKSFCVLKKIGLAKIYTSGLWSDST